MGIYWAFLIILGLGIITGTRLIRRTSHKRSIEMNYGWYLAGIALICVAIFIAGEAFLFEYGPKGKADFGTYDGHDSKGAYKIRSRFSDTGRLFMGAAIAVGSGGLFCILGNIAIKSPPKSKSSSPAQA